MTRAEHVRWAKERALVYLKANKPSEAVASMLSDLGKHPETRELASSIGMIGAFSAHSVEETRKFIEGFAE